MANVKSWVDAVNLIRQESDSSYREVVPMATEDNIAELGNILLNDAYQPQLNNFISQLVNRIGLTMIANKSFSNPLALFKKGSVPLGTDIQEIYTNPAESETYEFTDVAMAKLLTITDPDTKVAYYRLNRKDLYTKTIAREDLRGAFVSWEKFGDFVNSIVQSLYSGNYIDEFEYTKRLIDGAYDNNKIITELVVNPVDEATGKAFVKKARALYKLMALPSSKFNAYSKFAPADRKPVKTWTTPERIVFITTADVMANVDVDVLASSFNLSRADFLGRVIEVDEFKNSNIKAVICDESFLQIYDNLLRFDEFYNARVMAWNEYLHAWGTYAVSPFANAVCLCTELPVPVETISFASESITITGVDEDEEVQVTLSPTTATSDIVFEIADETIATIEQTANDEVKVTSKSAGSTTLTAKADNGVTASVTIVVTA